MPELIFTPTATRGGAKAGLGNSVHRSGGDFTASFRRDEVNAIGDHAQGCFLRRRLLIFLYFSGVLIQLAY